MCYPKHRYMIKQRIKQSVTKVAEKTMYTRIPTGERIEAKSNSIKQYYLSCDASTSNEDLPKKFTC